MVRLLIDFCVAIILATALHFGKEIYLGNRELSNGRGSSSGLFLVDRAELHLLSQQEKQARSEAYLDAAVAFAQRPGDGNMGLVNLLAAFDFNPFDEFILDNVIDNYVRSNYVDLAFDELRKLQILSPKLRKDKLMVDKAMKSLQLRFPEEYREYETRRSAAPSLVSEAFPQPHLGLLFPTLLGRWDVNKHIPNLHEYNANFYSATVVVYEQMRDEIRLVEPDITDTQLNHRFFKWQMGILRGTGDYWEGYTKLPLFRDLIKMFQTASAQFLMRHGYSAELARSKALHNTIFWVSVHTPNSIHEPHWTEDSLIGGVYYVTVPEGSGQLGIFDPRGKSPVLKPRSSVDHRNGNSNSHRHDTDEPTSNVSDGDSHVPPSPPFHRTVGVQPAEGLLLLFPGWLVHTVYPSTGMDPGGRYRVSISVNLKGEWQDTASLMFDEGGQWESPATTSTATSANHVEL